MKYFVVEIQTLKAGGTAQSITSYDTIESAKSAYHSACASNYISTALSGFSVVCLNEHGGQEERTYYEFSTED